MESNQFWRLDRVKAETGLSTAAIYEKIAAGTFPKQIKISAQAVAWASLEIEAWKAKRLAERDSAKAAA